MTQMVVNHITTTITLLKDIFPSQIDVEYLGKNGKCYQVALLLRHIYPNSEILYDHIEGHIYTQIDGRFYDITGVVYGATPKVCEKDLYLNSHTPNRWHHYLNSASEREWFKSNQYSLDGR